MKIESTVLASVLALCMPLAAQAQNVERYENQVICSPGSECTQSNSNKQEQINIDRQEQININQQEEIENDNSQTQRTRTRTRTRTRASQRNNYYIGGNLGLFFPGDDADTGFGGSVFGGRNFGDYWSADLEFLFYAGGTEVDDLGYNILGILANVMGKYPFNQDKYNSPYVFGGGGLGYGRIAATGDVADDLEDDGVDTSEGGFAFQLKAGVGYPINDRTDVFGQFRYIDVSTDEGDGDGFSIDGGVTFKL